MPPRDRDDLDLVEHILAECDFLLSLRPSLTLEQLEAKGIISRAVCYSFVIIGESCHHLSARFKSDHSGIDWKPPYQMRNLLVHQHESIRYATVLETILANIPKLHGYLVDKKLD